MVVYVSLMNSISFQYNVCIVQLYSWIAGDRACACYVLPIKGYYSMVLEGITLDNVRESFGEHISEDYSV